MVEKIRPETETDRTEAALRRVGASIPLPRGAVEIAASDRAAASPTGQRIMTLLVNELARMKGVVSAIHLVASNTPVVGNIPLRQDRLLDGIEESIASLSSPESTYGTQVTRQPSAAPDVRLRIGDVGGAGLQIGADGWRALLGSYHEQTAWDDPCPFGACLAAALAATEIFKLLLAANAGPDSHRRHISDLAYSVFNYKTNEMSAKGPSLGSLEIADLAVVGCGAGGSASLYVLAMQPGLSGTVSLIEPSVHKPSNINRYLMTTASDVHEGRHKLGSLGNHLARFAPGLSPVLRPRTWEQLEQHPWGRVISTVDTVEARWNIQRRAKPQSEIVDAAVMDLLYSVLRVVPQGWCLECKHPYDPDLPLKQRAARWGVEVEEVQIWERDDVEVTEEMVNRLSQIQGKDVHEYEELVGKRFRDVPRLTECGETLLRTDIPSQAPVLPLATTAAGVVLAAEIAKMHAIPEAGLSNWLAHDLSNPERAWTKFRPTNPRCRRDHE